MGEHKNNPTAIAAKKGLLKPKKKENARIEKEKAEQLAYELVKMRMLAYWFGGKRFY